MATPRVPEEGELQLGPVVLPPGRRIVFGGEPVVWVTTQAVDDPGPVWSALADLHPQTGLVPVLLTDDPEEDAEDFFFFDPPGASEIDHLDAREVLAESWDGPLPWTAGRGSERAVLYRLKAARAVAGDTTPGPADRASGPFPGLAPPGDSRLSAEEIDGVLRALPARRVGLVPARRPADVLAVTGWTAFDDFRDTIFVSNGVWIGAVLRSWEDRFGARLLEIGPGAEIRLLVERPPRTLEAAQAIAAEHYAFCTECAGQGLREIPEIAAALVDSPIWAFWWD